MGVVTEKAKVNQGARTDLTSVRNLTNVSSKKFESVDTKKELAKVSGVSYDTIYKVKEIKSQTPAEILSELESNIITHKISINQAHKFVRAINSFKSKVTDSVELAKKILTEFEQNPTVSLESKTKDVIREVQREERDREIKEAEEKKRILAEQLRLEREEKERQEKERLRKEREEKERLEAERLEKEKAEKERLRLIREEEARIAREKYEAEKAEKERLRLERIEKERIEREKQAAERAERERIAREKLEAEKKEAERLRQIRLEEERVAREKAAKERAEQKRLADEEAERKRQERLKLEAEERERKRIEAEKKEAERREKLRLEEERLEKERIENEKLEAERREKERIEKEKLEAERLEAERLRKMQEEKDRIEREKLEAERLEREKEAQIKLEQFKAEQARIEQEKLAQFKAEQERIEQERLQAVIASELEKEIDKKFDVILCDPPWRYDFAETKNREIENQYPTMDLEEIKALAVPAADDCVLFMWATAPKLEQAFEVLRAWGFTYKTCAVWDKEKIGMGYWFRGQHELLLVGTRGNPGAPQPENRYSSVIRVKREGHSKKPECVYEMIEKMMPACNYLEMFARNKREKWACWGNQV